MEKRKIAFLTGASSGMGKEFVKQISGKYQDFDEIWAIARKEEPLEKLKQLDARIRTLSINLIKENSLQELQELLAKENPDIQMLVNCAGFGIQKRVADTEISDLWNMIQLNVTAFTAIIGLCLPYLGQNAKVLCISSGAAFIPQPGFGVYAATKSYVLSFSRALRRECKGNIHVTIVCPGPVDTPFLETMGGKEHMPSYKKWFLAQPDAVVKKAMKDCEKGKEFSIYGISIQMLRIFSKLIPHSWIMKFLS